MLVERIEWLFDKMLSGERYQSPAFLRHRWLKIRLAIIAGIEHFTCVLGNWVLRADALDAAGADPVMLDLLRWHGAEEVEHRAVAFDVLEHLAGPSRYRFRLEGMLAALPVMAGLWWVGTRYLVAHDPSLAGRRYRARSFVRAARQGLLPGWELARAVPRYLKPSHHPSQEGSLDAALAYLSVSPAARAYSA